MGVHGEPLTNHWHEYYCVYSSGSYCSVEDHSLGPEAPRQSAALPFTTYCSNYRTIALISHASKVMLKILQARLQQYVNQELPDVQAGLRKGRGTRDLIANIRWIMEKAREFQKNIYFCFIDYAKAFDCVDHNKLWKFFKRWEYQTT